MMLNCREATRVVLQGEDRALAWHERLRLRLHLGMCSACTRFVGQVRLMRGAMDRWKAYAEEDDVAPPR